VGHPVFPSTLESLIARHGGTVLDIARESVEREDVLEFEVPDPQILVPLMPSSIRSFTAFERRSRRARSGTGKASVTAVPLYSRREHRAMLGPDEEVAWPPFTEQLDFEAQMACVVGSGGRDLSATQAGAGIFGYVLMNGWVARDVEGQEIGTGVGPGKSRDFACSLGPYLITADELDPASVEMVVRVDEDVWAEGAAAGMQWTFPELLAYASLGEEVWPGDVLASGPFTGGTGADAGQFPAPGSTVELEGGPLGALRSRIGPKPRRLARVR